MKSTTLIRKIQSVGHQNTHRIYNMICLSNLPDCVFTYECMCNICNLIDDRLSKYEANAINIV